MIKKIITTACIMALSCTIACAEVSNEAKLQYNRGVDLYRLGQFEQAADAFKKAIAIDANYIDAYYNLGVVLEQMNENDAALGVFKQIIVRKPSDYEAVYNAASLSARMGQVENAKQYLSIIPQTSPIIPKAQALAASMNTDLQTIKKDFAAKVSAVKPKIPQSNGNYTNISSPTGITTDKNGNLYIASFGSNSITKITPAGARSVFVKSPKLNGPIDIASDSNGNIYAANYNADNVVKITPAGTITQLLGNVKKPYCLHIADGMLFVSSQGTNTVVRYKL